MSRKLSPTQLLEARAREISELKRDRDRWKKRALEAESDKVAMFCRYMEHITQLTMENEVAKGELPEVATSKVKVTGGFK